MNIINTPSVHSTQALQGPHRMATAKDNAQGQQVATQSRQLLDDVQFSTEALDLGNVQRAESSSAGVRFDLVNRVKAEIAAGIYDTPDKMDIALDRMIGRMNPR